MNDFGPHTAEVREVIDFACSGGVLRGPFRPDAFRDFDTRVVHSLDDVLRYREHHEPRTEAWSTREEWWDIRQIDMVEYHAEADSVAGYWSSGGIVEKIEEASDLIQQRLLELLPGVLPRDEIVQMADDFEMTMRFRAVFGQNDHIQEKFFRVYRASGYPVGWVGKFPEGQLVVFSR